MSIKNQADLTKEYSQAVITPTWENNSQILYRRISGNSQ